jgi:phage tail-like protein
LVGPVEYADVTLEYGLTDSKDMWNWMVASIEGRVERINVSVIMLKPDGVTEAFRWDLMNAWPAQWTGAVLDALSHEVAIASLTLVYESLEVR